MENPEPEVTLCVDCLAHDEQEEATVTDEENGDLLCGECYGTRIQEWNERAYYDWQPLYDDRYI